ncbi:MAG: hypothetical protein LIO40_06165 [Ruminococcus sp.]|nr:hypothetical protein [Ruminococcus sp.]
MNENECYFLREGGSCSALSHTKCTDPESCSFFKTHRQYLLDRNRAVLLNRASGYCENCEYVKHPCGITKIREVLF